MSYRKLLYRLTPARRQLPIYLEILVSTEKPGTLRRAIKASKGQYREKVVCNIEEALSLRISFPVAMYHCNLYMTIIELEMREV